MEVTIQEYNKAVETINRFHRQLESRVNQGKTSIGDFLASNKEVNVRTRNVLIQAEKHPIVGNRRLFIEDIDRREFFKFRNAGKKSWENFVEARGY